MTLDRRNFIRSIATAAGSTAALSAFPPAIARALAIAANDRTGTLEDVEHIVCFMQENRSFDHYFGSMAGVRGFADPFPIPVPDTALLAGRTVWYQRNDTATGSNPKVLAPQHNDTSANFALIRTADTPHLYPDAQLAWDHGRLSNWPQYKNNPSMVYFTQADIPFQFALANAFTLCDDNHCSFTGGTNPNRCFFFTGTNHGHDDPGQPGIFNGPAMDNSYNALTNGTVKGGYTWMTYAERLEDAGVSWQVYQNEEVEFYALNSLLGFRNFRDANAASTPSVSPTRTPRQQALYEKGIRTRDLDLLKADVIAGTLPKVSWICATSSGSEHPGASSPAQGAAYIAKVLDALTANPDVWSKTVLIINFDENDGFFDHAAPPAPPSYVTWNADPSQSVLAGASTVDASDEYLGDADGGITTVDPYKHHPFGLGPRVPMYVISPWSKGGWVNSQVFDQTSTIRFIEKRFGVMEPNISAWRRAVVGDLMSCFNFATPNDTDLVSSLPDTTARDAASRALGKTTTPTVAPVPVLPVQAQGIKPSRALPYALHATATVVTSTTSLGAVSVRLTFTNVGTQAAVFHVYDRNNLTAIPRRYTVEAGKTLVDTWAPLASGAYDLWVLAPNGFHRHFTGNARRVASAGQPNPDVVLSYDAAGRQLRVQLSNAGPVQATFALAANAYYPADPSTIPVAAHSTTMLTLPLAASNGWYDFSVRVNGQADYSRRFAGRMETGADSTSDPAMHGAAVGNQYKVS
ncbi:phosphocholine-specific phospholipase C [Scleromatobacter humisilvae]|uniref:phospholipase C n=1 Tax=Scleromatobacter humisilvae TaxID=2897159 RepID=A0A9X1YN11_9BURK|nr:phospholipase C, phosphocholine-specific [Scleromatobacter humisilvae]MCK9689006.1 phospholipase C, phosphocholine-specific [Scleromatobacter humisilvae]